MLRAPGTKPRCLPKPDMSGAIPTVWIASPGDPDTLTGGYIYNARVTAGLRAAGWDVRCIRLPDSFPSPSPSDQDEAKTLISSVPESDVLVVDGLALGAFSQDVLESIGCKLVALVHHPLADESGLSDIDVEAFSRSEKNALRFAAGVIVTSPHTADALVERFDVARDAICIAIPGVDRPETFAARADPPLLLSVGSLTARKGHDVLVEALSRIDDLPWRATIVGSAQRDPAVAQDVEMRIANLGLVGRVTLAGELSHSELTHHYKDASLFVLATRHEGYGMVFSEAMVHGLAIVSCAAGAVPDTVPETAGVLVPPNDVDAFAEVLRALLTDRSRLEALAAGSRAAGQQLPTWEDAARLFGEKLQRVAAS